MNINAQNFEQIFAKAIQRGEEAAAKVMAVYRWAEKNPQVVPTTWVKHAIREIRRVFGMSPTNFVNVATEFGAGDFDRGVEHVKRIGAVQCKDALKTVRKRDLPSLLQRIDNLDADSFHVEVQKILKKRSDAARELARAKEQREKPSESQAAELARLRRENAQLKEENAKLRERLGVIESALAGV